MADQLEILDFLNLIGLYKYFIYLYKITSRRNYAAIYAYIFLEFIKI